MRDKHSDPSGERKTLLEQLADVDYCYVTTAGRVSGRPHEIEIWFGISADALYLLSGGGEHSDWIKNMRAHPAVQVRIGRHTFQGRVRFKLDREEEFRARHLLAAKYQGWQAGSSLSNWAQTALPVAIDL